MTKWWRMCSKEVKTAQKGTIRTRQWWVKNEDCKELDTIQTWSNARWLKSIIYIWIFITSQWTARYMYKGLYFVRRQQPHKVWNVYMSKWPDVVSMANHNNNSHFICCIFSVFWCCITRVWSFNKVCLIASDNDGRRTFSPTQHSSTWNPLKKYRRYWGRSFWTMQI